MPCRRDRRRGEPSNGGRGGRRGPEGEVVQGAEFRLREQRKVIEIRGAQHASGFRGRFFDVGTVSEFNRLTKRFNAASTRAEQERTLDERQRFMLKVIQGSAFNRLAA